MTAPEIPDNVLQTLRRVVREDMRAAEAMQEQEVRYLVDLYYALQDYRIQAANQVRASKATGVEQPGGHERAVELESSVDDERAAESEASVDAERADVHESPASDERVVDLEPPANGERADGDEAPIQNERMNGEPVGLLDVVFTTLRGLEDEVAWALGRYASSQEAGRWALQMRGVGPVLTAGLLAHIDITKAPSPSSVWRFAGLDPTAVWSKGEKRPHNARLKVLCWKLGESWKRFSGPAAVESGVLAMPESLYCRLYRERKALETERNEAGQFAELAAKTLTERNIRQKETLDYYEAGKLPPGRLDLRATRYATKMFLSHFWNVLYEIEYGKKAPDPWAIAHGGHVDKIAVPLWPIT